MNSCRILKVNPAARGRDSGLENQVILIVGPTGAGKSEVALALAKEIHGEIISCDSMQMYRGMDIGTAKPTRAERKRIRHHLIDVLSPRARASAHQYRRMAVAALRAIVKRRRVPIVVGGSGFYVRALVDGIPPSPGRERGIRLKLERSLVVQGPAYLYARLKRLDPKRAFSLHPNDGRRIIRALEIYERSKRRPSEWLGGAKGLHADGFDFVLVGVDRDRKTLYRRVEERVDGMLEAGWVNEVRRLKKRGFSQTARAAIGYREILDYLGGLRDLEETAFEIKKHTRHLVKKQWTWFRRDKRIQWIRLKEQTSAAGAAGRIQKIIKAAHGAR